MQTDRFLRICKQESTGCLLTQGPPFFFGTIARERTFERNVIILQIVFVQHIAPSSVGTVIHEGLSAVRKVVLPDC